MGTALASALGLPVAAARARDIHALRSRRARSRASARASRSPSAALSFWSASSRALRASSASWAAASRAASAASRSAAAASTLVAQAVGLLGSGVLGQRDRRTRLLELAFEGADLRVLVPETLTQLLGCLRVHGAGLFQLPTHPLDLGQRGGELGLEDRAAGAPGGETVLSRGRGRRLSALHGAAGRRKLHREVRAHGELGLVEVGGLAPST